jgi:hypothetical protein
MKVALKPPVAGGPGFEMDYLDFIARVTAHIPDKGQVEVNFLLS